MTVSYLQPDALQILYGREDVLTEVMDYLSKDNANPTPLALVGFPGSGKSAVIAYIAKNCVSSTEDTAMVTTYFYVFI